LKFVIRNSSFVISYSPFHAFDTQHLVTLAAIAALCLLLALAAKSATPGQRKWVGRLLGFSLLGYAACIYLQQGMAHELNFAYSLPLDLCHLVLIACVISLFWPNQLSFEIAYFWGLGGVVQAILTPDLTQGFPSWEFILFFWGHGATLLSIVFLIAGQRFRPRKGSVVRMMVALNIYGLAVGLIDAIMSWNYGYLCRKTLGPSLLDYAGQWPWYLLSVELIAFVTFFLLNLLWNLRLTIDD
jgi:hypothetical integral membrane protein (TIGR02206 family)